MNIDCNHFQALLVERRSELLRLLEDSAAASAPVELDQQVQGRLFANGPLTGPGWRRPRATGARLK